MQNNIRRRGNCYLLYSRRGSKAGQDYIVSLSTGRKSPFLILLREQNWYLTSVFWVVAIWLKLLKNKTFPTFQNKKKIPKRLDFFLSLWKDQFNNIYTNKNIHHCWYKTLLTTNVHKVFLKQFQIKPWINDIFLLI